MPRTLRNQDALAANTEGEVRASGKYQPWLGDRQELEAPELDDAGKVIKVGRPLFYVERNKLIGVYRGGSGISRRLWANLKPPIPKNENDVRAIMRARELKAFREKLKRAKIPGA